VLLRHFCFASIIQRWGMAMVVCLHGRASQQSSHSSGFRVRQTGPEEHPRVNAAELDILESSKHAAGRHSFRLTGTPWRKMLSSRSVWALILSYFCHGYTPYIYFTWFFYLPHARSRPDDRKKVRFGEPFPLQR